MWDGLQATAFDLSAVLPGDGVAGTLLSGMFGYTDTPTLGEVLVYFAYLIPALALFFLPVRTKTSVSQAQLRVVSPS